MFKRFHLENGIPLVVECIRNVHSVTLGIWVKVGSRFEPPDKNGLSHFLEHMFFKGTKKRSARDIAFEIDSIGGDLNAFTSRENTTFYVKVLDQHFDKGVDLLTDIFLHSTFPEEDIVKEKKIIKEEIKMVEDTPDDYINDLFYQDVWGNSGIGLPVLGKRETVRSFKREDILDHIRKYYGTRDVIIACVGNFNPEALLESLNKALGGLRRGSELKIHKTPEFRSSVNVYQKDLSEVHVCIGVKGLSQSSPDRYALYIINAIFGAGVSSRLFQGIRENRGLVYSIYSFIASYIDTGLFGVYAGTSKKKVSEVINLIMNEFKGLKDTISEEEIKRAKEQIKGNLILGLESTSNRMQNIARQEIYYGKYYSPDEVMRLIDAVTLGQVKDLAERLTGDAISITLLGPVQPSQLNLPPL